MNPSELEVALQLAFRQCLAQGYALSDRQQQIVRTTLLTSAMAVSGDEDTNPLDQLLPAERQALLAFIAQQINAEQDWKAVLLNDWLNGQDSGRVQFLRKNYGVQWLQQIQPSHLAKYDECETMPLQIGDRIEISNGLWEWVKDNSPCSREWFTCTVIGLQSVDNQTNCILRFDNGSEYEMQAVYDWNRPNWRWLGEQS
jgi:hypothetical protein